VTDLVTGSRATERSPRVFASAETVPDARALTVLAEGIRDADLLAPPVVLPDFLHKSKQEMPSSIAIATRDTIRPTFTSSSVNCGMALLAMDAEPPSVAAVEEFFNRMKRRFPWPPKLRTELRTREVLDAAERGAAFAADRFDLDASNLERIEEGGAISIDKWGGRDRLQREIPWLVRQLARLRFGSMGPSNHFIEVQRVEEVLDEQTATRLGLKAGQMTIQYHGGGGVLAGLLGRLYAERLKVPKAMRPVLAVQKPLHHLARATSAQRMLRKALYFSPRTAVPRDGDEGQRFMLANAAAMNYGFAFRLAAYGHILSVAEETFGATGGRLIVDSPHNSIYEEEVDGTHAVVHRHNSCRAYPASRMPAGTTFASTGQALLLPGTHRTSSYACVAGDRAADSLHSACHGAGSIVKDFETRGLSASGAEAAKTLRFRYDRDSYEEVPQLDDRGVDEALDILQTNGLVRAIARMRPMGVLH
jgi:RNA-splicing ligase RtcB